LKKSFAAAGWDSVVAVVERQLYFDGAVILEFGRSVAGDLVAFVETAPAEEDDSTGIFEFAARRDAPEGERRPSRERDLEIAGSTRSR
jgi:hypothetical protein